ncbi:helix-turn-helix domain-containing protein [Propionibacterium acidifaciens]|uniref:MerR family transcriptional regulator n=1 Tax=Propionibacterium acidifaciens TaxID=556499 RepID=UPI00360E5B28
MTTREVSRAFGVDPSTVRRWIMQGKLAPALVTPGGQYRFRKADLQIPSPTSEPPAQAPEHQEVS